MVNVDKLKAKGFIKPRDEGKGNRSDILRRELRETDENLDSARRSGTNYILNELFGIDHKDINEYAMWYGSRVLKHGSRIAAENHYRGGPKVDFRYLFEAVALFGGQAVSDLLRQKRDLATLITEFDISDINGFKILTPFAANVPLEIITKSQNISDTLGQKGLSPIYRSERVMIFDYARK